MFKLITLFCLSFNILSCTPGKIESKEFHEKNIFGDNMRVGGRSEVTW